MVSKQTLANMPGLDPTCRCMNLQNTATCCGWPPQCILWRQTHACVQGCGSNDDVPFPGTQVHTLIGCMTLELSIYLV